MSDHPVQFFLVHRDPEFIAAVHQALSVEPNFSLEGTAGTGREALYYLRQSSAQVLLLQIALPDMDGFDLLQQVQDEFGMLVVPILEGNEGGETWQRILTLNIRRVINGFMPPQALADLLKSVASEAGERKPAKQGYVISVASARGGVGKTVFATNLAIAMAKMHASVALVDYSMSAGDFFTMLDLVPRNTIKDAIDQGDQLDLQFLRTLLADHPYGFKFLACPNQDFNFYNFSKEQAVNLLNLMREISPYTLVDTGAYDLPPSIAAVDVSDVCFLITTRDLARLLALQRFIKAVKERGAIDQKLRVVVNNAEVGTEISESEIEAVLEHQVTAYLPSCPLQTTFSINSGKPLIQTKSDLPLCAVINKLAEYSVHRWQEV